MKTNYLSRFLNSSTPKLCKHTKHDFTAHTKLKMKTALPPNLEVIYAKMCAYLVQASIQKHDMSKKLSHLFATYFKAEEGSGMYVEKVITRK